jgi:hypothetical protein
MPAVRRNNAPTGTVYMDGCAVPEPSKRATRDYRKAVAQKVTPAAKANILKRRKG